MTSENTLLKIRRASVADAVLLADMGARTYFDTFTGTCTPEDMELFLRSTYSVEMLTHELLEPRTTYYIAEVNGTAAGFAKIHHGEIPDCVTGENPIELGRLYLDKPWIGKGVGQALMQTCVAEARRRGHQSMFLGVWENNFRAQAFYRKWGFEKIGEHVFQVGNDPQNDWLMQCHL
jgi:ribosomal protein S18 acetylase RimI-like enzyme